MNRLVLRKPERRLTFLLAAWMSALSVSIALSPGPEAAAHEQPAVGEANEPAMVAALRANGARILALGERGGLDGHFVELADGDAYGLYLTPDGHAVAGLLYGPDGTLLTGRQIETARSEGGDAMGTAAVRPVSAIAPVGEISVAGGSHGEEAPSGDEVQLAHRVGDLDDIDTWLRALRHE